MAPSPYAQLVSSSQEAQLFLPLAHAPFSALPPQPPVVFGERSGSNVSLPSSGDDEFDEKDRFEGEGSMEDGLRVGATASLRSSRSRRKPIIWLLGIFAVALLIGVLAASLGSGQQSSTPTVKKRLTIDSVLDGTFFPKRASVQWVAEAGDGIFARQDQRGVWLEDVNVKNVSRLLLDASQVVDADGERLSWSNWKLSPDLQFIMLWSDRQPQWRHSSHSNIYLHSLLTNATFPLVTPSYPPTIAYAAWAPVGHALAFVQDNDLYVLPSSELSSSSVGAIARVTDDGTADVFNGVPDWVYEEEVFSGESALWWAPSGDLIAFLKSNESAVPTYEYPLYDFGGTDGVKPYPKEVVMKYPKPGYPNPLVSVHLFSLASFVEFSASSFDEPSVIVKQATRELVWEESVAPESQVIFEVAWVGKKGSTLLVKESDRSASIGSVVVFDVAQTGLGEGSQLKGSVSRKLSGGDGWIEQAQTSVAYGNGYLDRELSPDGFYHIAFFANVEDAEPVWITKGDWEVDGAILGVDPRKNLVYFSAAKPSIERHIYSASLPVAGEVETLAAFQSILTPLDDVSRPGYFSARFSPEAGYYVEAYDGPGVPRQRIVKLDDEEGDFTYPLEQNAHLNETLAAHVLPVVNQLAIPGDGYELNVREIRPPNMDESGKTRYPVLLAPYGGPNSQSASVQFKISYNDFLAAEMKYIILIVDGRGTGFKGRVVRDPVRGQLGKYEALDQIEAARLWAASKHYVDAKRVGIWGWSFGGFLTAKVLEKDSGVVSLGIAVAPVTDWRYYDSIYTERFMQTPDRNVEGYAHGGVNNMTGFSKSSFFLAHGTGDDNVHFANSASLVEKLTKAKIRGYETHFFPDSNHGMGSYGAYRELFDAMQRFLEVKWGWGGSRRGGRASSF